MTISNPPHDETAPVETPLADALSFIETQFPVAKISMESYKERTAKQSQTLTGLGKWWGRKPLVLVRAALLGLLMPASDDPTKDREIFLKLMTMDHEGLIRRKSKTIPGKRMVDVLQSMPPSIQNRFLSKDHRSLKRGISRDERAELQKTIFNRLSYGEKLEFCDRPEHVDGPTEDDWHEINSHLGTKAVSLRGLVEQLGLLRFGHRPRVGDAFCGGGSIPFESARLGCSVYGSDLNPVAALLTWASLNIIGGGQEVAASVREAQQRVYNAVDGQITEWGIEHNSLGWRADAYLYCTEITDPETGWKVPLAPSWVIGRKTMTIARLIPDEKNKRYNIEILEGVSEEELLEADAAGTIQNSRVVHSMGSSPAGIPIEVIRRNLRMWGAQDIIEQPDDVFQERLFCIRWVETLWEDGKEKTVRHYRSPSSVDFERETKVLSLVLDRFDEWQEKGYIPSLRIEPGDKTDEPIRTRGWAYWHQLFTPRQLLLIGSLKAAADKLLDAKVESVATILGTMRAADYASRLSRWHSHGANEKPEQVFSNQALNTLYNFGSRTLLSLSTSFFIEFPISNFDVDYSVSTSDARNLSSHVDMWLTDPPYADAVSYHELSEFFLAWNEKAVRNLFPTWYSDSKRAMAVAGSDSNFRRSMVDCYRNLAAHMPDNGMQIVMFTHQDASVWADLSLILWASGLRVTAAWTIATETDSALKQGNYVQGTVLLVLRKRTETEPIFLDEITHEIDAEVRRQIDSMTALDDNSDPNFGDADYQLAAYAAALRVLTARPIYEIDPAKEVLRERRRGETSIVEDEILKAVKIACDHLVPRDFDTDLWKTLSPAERFYCKGIEVESHGEYRSGVYQELARGFGAADYTDLMGNTRANETRLKTPTEFGRRMLSGDGFGGTLLRQVLFAVQLSAKSDETSDGLNYLKTERPDYWNERAKIVHLLGYLARLRDVAGMDHWRKDAAAADLLAGAVRNDHV